MVVEIENMNAILPESAANTYTDEKFEIPGSSGAKKVVLRKGQLACSWEGATVNGVIQIRAAVLAGDHTSRTSMALLGDDGVIGFCMDTFNGDGTDYLGLARQSPVECVTPWDIPKGKDGKYYITLLAQSFTAAAARKAMFAGSFLIER